MEVIDTRVPRNLNEEFKSKTSLQWENETGRKVKMPQGKPRFGLLFDCDGVIARGANVLPCAQEGFKLISSEGKLTVPVAFVTNACNRDADKARSISKMLGVEISPEQVIHATSPLRVFTRYHNKHVLLVGQGPIREIAEDMGFKNVSLIEDFAASYPLLDMVDHDNRRKVAQGGWIEKEYPRIEAIVLMGEPKRWESSLQLLVDILMTSGKPNKAPKHAPHPHIPVIACNMDLQFMAEACMPRYGHGAFLVCLESLYRKVSGHNLHYTSLIGKPSEITYRYAEHVINQQAKGMGLKDPIRRLYFFGDNHESDIVGSNLYQEYIDRIRLRRSQNDSASMDISSSSSDSGSSSEDEEDAELPSSRCVPSEVQFSRQTVEVIESILLSTGVWKPGDECDRSKYRGHRDFIKESNRCIPTKYSQDCYEGMVYALEKEAKLERL